MSYTIEALPITTFLDDSTLKLPRFQRKATWKKKQNFELAISVFQDYPVGVVIVNKEKNQSWLLDGRQRRTALKTMREDPVQLYDWAKTYIGFKATEDQLDIQRLYWSKVERYLRTDTSAMSEAEDEDAVDYEGAENDRDDDENSFDSHQQREGLKTLLDLILMVHQVKKGVSRWEKLFDFTEHFGVLPYAPRKAQGVIQPAALRKWILELASATKEELTVDSFVDFYLDRSALKQESLEESFRQDVINHWADIKTSVDTLARAEKVFTDARIGVIILTKASPLDAQNIFSRINAGGTQLTAEELLSAKPYWNKEVQNVDDVTDNEVSKLYKSLDVPKPESVVRWDIAATLLSRIDPTHLVFDKYSDEELSLQKVSLGFKLLSSFFVGGMSSKSVIELESYEGIDWNRDISNLVLEINQVCEVLLATDFFKFFDNWNRSITSLLGYAEALEFLTIVWKDWRDHNKPTASSGSSDLHAVQRDAKVLFDRLVYEYATRQWRGSGDSRMARDIKEWKQRLTIVGKDDWHSFIEGAVKGSHNGQATTVSILRPVLYYYYVLTDQGPGNGINVSFDVDHIIPKEKFADNQSVDANLRDSLGNLALLPKKDNVSKKNKLLNEVTDPWLKSQISAYTGISQSDFATYSSVAKVNDLVKERVEYYYIAFDDRRTDKLSY